MIHRLLVVCCVLCTASGCIMHMNGKLRHNSVHQASSVRDMQQQQVLDNLAMFMCYYNAMPYFSYPNQSGAQVSDQANIGGSASGGRPNSQPISVLPQLHSACPALLQRSQQEAYTVTPVNDPRKLELMRCAYQLAIRNCGCGAVSGDCPDCQTRFKVFYTGDPNGDISQGANGIVTSECLKTDCCWFHVGCEKCWHKHGSCDCYGEYCGIYVWVPPEGQDELAKLTLGHLGLRVARAAGEAHQAGRILHRFLWAADRAKAGRGQGDRRGGHRRAPEGTAERGAGRPGPHRAVPRLPAQARQGAAGGHDRSAGEEDAAGRRSDAREQAGLPARATPQRRPEGTVLSPRARSLRPQSAAIGHVSEHHAQLRGPTP